MSVVKTILTNCDLKGCSHKALFAPKINVPFENMSLDQHEPLNAIIGLRLCERHIDGVKVEDFSNLQPVFEQLARSSSGGLNIDWGRAFFSKVKIGSPEYLKYEKVSNGLAS